MTTNRIITSEVNQKLVLRTSWSSSQCSQLPEAHSASSDWSRNVTFPYTCIRVRPPIYLDLEKTGLLILIIQIMSTEGSITINPHLVTNYAGQ